MTISLLTVFFSPQEFAGKNVLVVGLASTAADTSSELVGHAAKIYISHRRGNNIVSRDVRFNLSNFLLTSDPQFARWCKGKPIDIFGNRRASYIRGALAAVAPKTAEDLFNQFGERLADSCFELDPAWHFKPAPAVMTHGPMVSDDFVDHLRAGSITSVAGVRAFVNDHHVELEDGLQLDVDAVIFCTGYKPDFSLMPQLKPVLELSPSASAPEQDQSAQGPRPLACLYQNIFPPAHADSIAYTSNWMLGDGISPNADLVTMAIAQIWKGNFPLPSEEDMNRAVDAHHAWIRAAAAKDGNADVAGAEIVQQGPWIDWLNDAAGTGVNEYLGYGVQGWKFWLREPVFCNLLMGGVVNSPHVWRLFDGRRKKWEGAREAIVRVNRDAETVIRERARKCATFNPIADNLSSECKETLTESLVKQAEE